MSRHMNTGRKLSRNTSHRRVGEKVEGGGKARRTGEEAGQEGRQGRAFRKGRKGREARQAEEGKEEGRTRKAVVLLFPLPAFQCQRGGLKDHRGDAEGA